MRPRQTARPTPRRRVRVRLETDERRAQLLRLAQAAFATRSYDDVSMDELARQAGVSKGLLYHYFPTKRDLYLAGLRQAAQELLAATLVEAPGASPIQRIRAGLDAYLAFVSQRAAAYTALLRGGIGSDPEVAAVLEETRQAYLEHILRGAAGAPLPAPLVELPLLRVALRGWIGMVEAASVEWLSHREVEGGRLRDLLVDLLFRTVEAAVGSSLTAGW